MTGARDKAGAAIREAAAEWLVRLEEGATAADRVAFAAWLRASPLHVRAYLHAEAGWLALRDAARGDEAEVEALLRQVDDNVIALATDADAAASATAGHAAGGVIDGATDVAAARAGGRRRPRGRAWRPLLAAAASAALLAAGGLALWTLQSPRGAGDDRATDIGEMRRIVLADGSAIELNTQSRVRIEFRDDARDIRLERGEAFFSVAKDPLRPFRVFSGDTLVRAVGTEFNVYRKPGEVVVTVVEGRVAVQPAPAEARAIDTVARDDGARVELGAGHRLQVPGGDLRMARTSVVDPQRALAWRQRRLVFDDLPLAEIVDEFNRYNRTRIAVRDPALAARRLSGVFDPDKPESLLAYLARDGTTTTRKLADGRVLIVRADEAGQ